MSHLTVYSHFDNALCTVLVQRAFPFSALSAFLISVLPTLPRFPFYIAVFRFFFPSFSALRIISAAPNVSPLSLARVFDALNALPSRPCVCLSRDFLSSFPPERSFRRSQRFSLVPRTGSDALNALPRAHLPFGRTHYHISCPRAVSVTPNVLSCAVLLFRRRDFLPLLALFRS